MSIAASELSQPAQVADWEGKAQISRNVLEDSIPRQWMLASDQLPPEHIQDVTKIPESCGILSAEELQVTSSDVSTLLTHYLTGKYTVEAVTIAFLKRSAIGHQLLNFATEFLVDSALESAKELDAYFRRTQQLRGPLHGIPISVKEHVAIGSKICHASFVSKVENIAPEDAHMVQLLKRAGAVIHVRTNQPQSIMHLDCNNNITGMTLNPIHRRLSPGGSSGGEGASLGFRCAVLGIGTDIGGSVRVPASFCNVYGFKPTALRNPALGLVGVMGGQESIRGCVGPLGQSIDGLIQFQKAIWNQEPWETETSLVPLPWRETSLSPDSMTIGVMLEDGLCRPHPPVVRALLNAEKKLQAAGFKTVRWEPEGHVEGWELVQTLYFADAGARLLAALEASEEPMLPLTKLALSRGPKKPLTIHENWDCNLRRERLRRDYHRKMRDAGVDVILCPAYSGVGALQGAPKYWNYTAIWNILDQPAVSFPSGTYADKDTDTWEAALEPRNTEEKEEWANYDPELYHGFPVSIQLAGKHHRDEELLEAVKLVDTVLQADCAGSHK